MTISDEPAAQAQANGSVPISIDEGMRSVGNVHFISRSLTERTPLLLAAATTPSTHLGNATYDSDDQSNGPPPGTPAASPAPTDGLVFNPLFKSRSLSFHALPPSRQSMGRGHLRTRSKFLAGPRDSVDNLSLIKEAAGVRVWYDDYTTIDWIHEFVKEQTRIRSIRSLKGTSGMLMNMWDSVQAWLLVVLIGVVCGMLAAAIAISSDYLSSLKHGYCGRGFLLSHEACCGYNTTGDVCTDWTAWPLLVPSELLGAEWTGFGSYCLIGTGFILVSALLVYCFPNQHKVHSGEFKTAYYAAGGGIPEVKIILSGFVIRGFLGLQTLIVKCTGLVFSVASGMITGKEGPCVHIACCVGNIACRLFDKFEKNDAKRREILSASAAAGVAMAFGAPIGGVLFSLEQVSYYFPHKTMFRSYLCALVAAMTLKFINPFENGKIVMFQVTYDREWHWFDMGFFLLLGVFGGLYGVLFCKLNALWVRYRRQSWMKRYPVHETLCLVLVTLVVSYPNIYTRMSLTDLVTTLFEECRKGDYYEGLCVRHLSDYGPILQLLLVAFLNRATLTILTFGTRVPHGVFLPSLVVGALMGRITGTLVEYAYRLHPASAVFASCGGEHGCIVPGVYAIVGAAAVLCGTTRMTMSLVVIFFELTGNLTYIMPMMLSIMVSKWVSDFFCKDSIYDAMIRIAGYPYLDNQHTFVPHKSIVELLQTNVETIDLKDANTIADLRVKLAVTITKGLVDGGFPILDGHRLIGYISCSELEYVLEKVRHKDDTESCYFNDTHVVVDVETDVLMYNNFTPFVDQAPLAVTPNASAEMVAELFRKLGLRYLCVVDDGCFQGVIHKKRFISYLRDDRW
ncbi:hypothetical protein H4R34_000814 [Dimargaris verticillata]|uniref:Chloride channel protein n=1 Tax=Dimargaris verticillata TaxID=2761393 RepID=A0A9W8BBW4_9FUNG|nr:hypothetical protein H4R34_000814 [Dimargaris verticillata]